MGMRTISFKIEEELLTKLDITARRLGLHRSEAIRLAIAKFIESYEKEELSKTRIEHLKVV